MTRLRIASPPTKAQQKLGKLVGLTQVWVNTYPRPTPSGGITWVDAHWRNLRPGESTEGKITKPGKALTARERAKAGVKIEPPDVIEPGMKVRDARDPTRTGVVGSRTGAPMDEALSGERWWAVLWDSVGESLLHQPHPERDLIPIPADQTRHKIGARVESKKGIGGLVGGETGTVREEVAPPTLVRPARYGIEWDSTGTVETVDSTSIQPSATTKPKFKMGQFLTLPAEVPGPGEVAQVESLYHDPDKGVVYVFRTATGLRREVYEEFLSEPLVDPDLQKKWEAKPPAKNATVETAARRWSALAYERESRWRNWARDDTVRALDLEQQERAWDEGGTPETRKFGQSEERLYWRNPRYQAGDWNQRDKAIREAHDDSALIADRMEKHFDRKSRWTGAVKHETARAEARGVWASVSWEGVLAVDEWHGQRSTVASKGEAWAVRNLRIAAMHTHASVLVHEMAHALSSAIEDKQYYPGHPAYEEGVVEGWNRAFYADMTKGPEFGPHDKGSLSEARSEVALDLEHRPTDGTYQKYIDQLNDIAIALHFVTVGDSVEARSQGYRRFYDMMIRIPLPLRRAAIVEMMEAGDLTPVEQARISQALRKLDEGKPL